MRASSRLRALGPQWSTVEQPSQDEKEALLWSEELGSICSSLSPSPTHLLHATNINPFENKVWEIYFYKEVCSFIQVIIIVDYVSAYICIHVVVLQLYNNHSWRYKGFNIFPRGISSKANVITQLEFKLLYLKTGVENFGHYTRGITPHNFP